MIRTSDGVMHWNCWEDGPYLCRFCRKEIEYLCDEHPDAGAVSSTCLKEDGHSGKHQFTALDEIQVVLPQ